MAVVLRLTRHGKKKSPFYRIVAADGRRPRDGKFLEIVGTYDPRSEDNACRWKVERVQYWLSKGARPSETVSHLLPKELA